MAHDTTYYIHLNKLVHLVHLIFTTTIPHDIAIKFVRIFIGRRENLEIHMGIAEIAFIAPFFFGSADAVVFFTSRSRSSRHIQRRQGDHTMTKDLLGCLLSPFFFRPFLVLLFFLFGGLHPFARQLGKGSRGLFLGKSGPKAAERGKLLRRRNGMSRTSAWSTVGLGCSWCACSTWNALDWHTWIALGWHTCSLWIASKGCQCSRDQGSSLSRGKTRINQVRRVRTSPTTLKCLRWL